MLEDTEYAVDQFVLRGGKLIAFLDPYAYFDQQPDMQNPFGGNQAGQSTFYNLFKAWGIEPVSLVTPAEVKELVPFIDETVILGGFYTPSVGVVDSLRAGTIMRERGQESGRLTVSANTEVVGIDVAGGRVRRVRVRARWAGRSRETSIGSR